MSKVSKQSSGAQKRKSKHDQLIRKVASQPGQLKISDIFVKSIESNCLTKTVNDTTDDEQNCNNPIRKGGVSEFETQNCYPEHDVFNTSTRDRAQCSPESDIESLMQIDSLTPVAGGENSISISLQNSLTDKENICQRSVKNLSIEWLLKNYDCLRFSKVKENGKMRPIIHCAVCKEYEKVAKFTSKNGSVSMSIGVRVDGSDKLQRVLTHLESKHHTDAVSAKRSHELWINQSEDHVWRKLLNCQQHDLIQLLLPMAMDIYNDSLHDTLPAWNWASRSLTQCRSDQFVNSINEGGFDAALPSFHPSDMLLRYRNLVAYAEMLEIIYQLEVQRNATKINNSLCFCMMVDGSIDRSRSDNKFVCARCINSDSSISSVFLSVVQPKLNGAKGLLEAAVTALEQTKVNRDKLASLVTDGEKANTGRHAGLWKLLEEELKRKLLTIWCACHRTDLAYEDLEDLVPEIKTWKVVVHACTNFFRGSKCATKSMEEWSTKIGIKTLSFPKHFEVRFAEHLHAELKALIRNLPACSKVWMDVVDSKDSTTFEKKKASDFLHTWQSGSPQCLLTGLMFDVIAVFTSLEKGLQKSHLILPDVLTLRDAAIRKLEIMTDEPIPGGEEENFIKANKERDGTIRSYFHCDQDHGKYDELRSSIISNTIALLSRRLNVEEDEDGSINAIKNIVSTTTCAELVRSSVIALKLFLDDEQDNSEKIKEMVDNICEQWHLLNDIPALDVSDIGCKYSVRLRKMFVKSTGVFQWLLGVFLVTSPHNMGTERVVSHFNKIKSIHRQSTNEETMTRRLTIAINGVGTAHYDPRPAVIKFLQTKDRRFRVSDPDLYQNHDFVKKFFRTDSTV